MTQKVCLQQHEEILTKLLEFVNNSHSQSWDLRSDMYGSGVRESPFRHEIPTAVLVAGQLNVGIVQEQVLNKALFCN